MKTFWVVGDSFRGAAEQDGVRTAAEMLAALASGAGFREDVRLRAGLGVSTAVWHKIRDAARAHPTVSVEPSPPVPADHRAVTKKFEDNVTIAEPDRVDVNTFTATLVLHDDSEMVRDQPADRMHVPGFALAEAAAQLVRWAVPKRFPAPRGEPDRYAVMHAMRCRFERFTFPFPARLVATFDVAAVPAAGERSDRIPVTARVAVHQGGRRVCTCEYDFHAFCPDTVFAIEKAQATKLLRGEELGSEASETETEPRRSERR